MKQSTLRLLALVSGIYIALLLLFRSFVPETVSPTVTLLALPLILIAIVLTLDLSDRATLPSHTQSSKTAKRLRARDVRFLTKQVEVAARASPTYFETILRHRLREALAEKVSLETGLDKESVRRSLADPDAGPRLLKDPETYKLLYYTPPHGTQNRLQLLRQSIERIEAWKA